MVGTLKCLEKPHHFTSCLEALKKLKEEDPSVKDQYYPPFVIVDESGKPVGPIVDGDAVVTFNSRADRMVMLAKAFEHEDFNKFDRVRCLKVKYAGMLLYDADLKLPTHYLVSPPEFTETSGEYLVHNGDKSWVCSETVKFGHVTFVWNGNRPGQFSKTLEKYVEIPSHQGISFDKKPEMKAIAIAEKAAEALRSGEWDKVYVSAVGLDGLPMREPEASESQKPKYFTGVKLHPAKRRKELATQAVFQAFALGDEQEETSPDEDLLTMTMLKHQRIALSWMVHRESGRYGPCGGILADDQGLGKTISTIALILKNRAPVRKLGSSGAEASMVDLDGDEDEEDRLVQDMRVETGQWGASTSGRNGSLPQGQVIRSSGIGRPAAGTLVVCPTSVLRQWEQEIRDKVAPAADLRVLVYHGSNRIKDPQEIARYDVVLTTFSIVSLEVPKPPTEEIEKGGNGMDYGMYGLSKAKKEKTKEGKGMGKGMVEGADGEPSKSVDAGPLARVAWFRVVLDEAQSIKNYRTKVACAAWGLRAKYRWCLSGTPIQNSIDDLFSYFRFLRYAPWDVYKNFQHDINLFISRNPDAGYKKLQAILKPIVLRRTKTSLIDGNPIVNLPPRIVNFQQSEFSLEERSFYTNLETASLEQFQEYNAAGTVQKNYMNILLMLLRLRQACDHPLLVTKFHKSEASHKSTLEAVRKLHPPQRAELIQYLEGGQMICPICQDAPGVDAVVSICGHVFCRQCISLKTGNVDDTTCPYPKCKKGLSSSCLFTLAALRDPGVDDDSNSIGHGDTDKPEMEPTWHTSSKIDAVISTLLALPKLSVLEAEALEVKEGSAPVLTGSTVEKVDYTEKAIVFSQWTSMLDLLETPLKVLGFNYRRLDGTMSVAARDRAVSDFKTLPEVTVMIMSLKAASLGLNMVAANHVLLLDLWWNPTTEDQAIDRAHRIGQTRTVNVSRFTVKNTVEDRILALQEKKRQIVASAFGETGGGDKGSRLTTEDLRFLFRM